MNPNVVVRRRSGRLSMMIPAKPRVTPEDLAAETLLIYPVQRQRLDIWRHFLQPAGISPQLKSVDNTLLLIQMVAARMGIAALPHWVACSHSVAKGLAFL